MSRKSAKHRKPTRLTPARPGPSARHRKPSPVATALERGSVKIAGAVTGAALVVGALSPGMTHYWSVLAQPPVSLSMQAALNSAGSGAYSGSGAALHGGRAHAGGSAAGSAAPGAEARAGGRARAGRGPGGGGSGQSGGSGQAAAGGGQNGGGQAGGSGVGGRTGGAGTSRGSSTPAQRSAAARHTAAAVAAVYSNPVRDISGLIPERIDQGVDFGGSGPIYALGNAVITSASGSNYGWPGGGWITYRLTSGPAAGLTVFVAEDVRPAVQAGQAVTSSTVIANMFNGGDGIETGWAMASTFTAESQLAEAGGISGNGPFPTLVGLNFEELLQALGVPAANNREATPYGILPSQYPANWPAVLYPQQ